MANLWRRVAAEGAVVKSEGVGQAAVAQEKRGLLEAGAVPQGRITLRNLVKPRERTPCALRTHAARGGLRGKEFGQCGGLGIGQALAQLGQHRFGRSMVADTRVQFSKFEGNVRGFRRIGVGGKKIGRGSDQFLARTRTGVVRGENFRGGEGGGAWRGVGLGLSRAEDAFGSRSLAAAHTPLGQSEFGLEGIIDRRGAPGEGVEPVNLSFARLGRGNKKGPADKVRIARFALAEKIKGTAGEGEVFGRKRGDKTVGRGGGFFLRGAGGFDRCGERIVSAAVCCGGGEGASAQVGQPVIGSRSGLHRRNGLEQFECLLGLPGSDACLGQKEARAQGLPGAEGRIGCRFVQGADRRFRAFQIEVETCKLEPGFKGASASLLFRPGFQVSRWIGAQLAFQHNPSLHALAGGQRIGRLV